MSNKPASKDEIQDYVAIDEVRTTVSCSLAYTVPNVGTVEENAAVSNVERNGKLQDCSMHRVAINGKVVKVTDVCNRKVVSVSKDYDYQFVKMIDDNLNLKAMTVSALPIKAQNEKIVIVDPLTNHEFAMIKEGLEKGPETPERA